jgi:hypothetical protein
VSLNLNKLVDKAYKVAALDATNKMRDVERFGL